MKRLRPLALVFALAVLGLTGWWWLRPQPSAAASRHKVLILGIDGMDPGLLKRFIGLGLMPNFAKLMEEGDFRKLNTTVPPQSPVAWATFSTGVSPAQHGIFDFIQRDTAQSDSFGEPYLSTSRTIPGKRWLIGNWVIPLSSDKVELLRGSKPFWAYLTERGIPATVFKVPSNYPPDHFATRAISGMGTPDMTGGYGTFSFFTDYPPLDAGHITGGKVYPVQVKDDTVHAELEGPANELDPARPRLTIPFTVYLDSAHEMARISIQDSDFILKKGEWSDWVRVNFEALPVVANVSGICRFYLKNVSPDFELYVSPVNVDPADSVLPISYPSSYARELCDAVGPFYTQGMPEDTKALSAGVLTDEEFIEQAKLVLAKRIRLYDYELSRLKQGVLFFYFSSLDPMSHMFYRTLNPEGGPLTPKEAEGIPWFYHQIDGVLGYTLKHIDSDTTLIIMSDHGFAPFRRCFQVNTWLERNGYITRTTGKPAEFFPGVDWSHTVAYNLGINGLYLNLKGREPQGIVDPEAKDALLDEISRKLLAIRDPKTGEPVLWRVYKTSEMYHGPYLNIAPDLILGFNRGYRASWETVLGEFAPEIINDNEDKWSGDHCMAAELVPGVLLSNRKLGLEHPSLYDIAPSVLAEYGIAKPSEMSGREIWKSDH